MKRLIGMTPIERLALRVLVIIDERIRVVECAALLASPARARQLREAAFHLRSVRRAILRKPRKVAR